MLAALFLVGCAEKSPPPYTTVFMEEKPYVPKQGSDNAYDAYLSAAREAAELVPAGERRRSFTAGFKSKTVATLEPVLESVSRATRSRCEFVYQAHPPFAVNTVRQDWFLIGRALAWKVEALMEAGEVDSAVDWALVGVRFGCDLSQGDVEDATVGYGVVSEIRQALRAKQEQLATGQLQKLSQGIVDALGRIGSADEVIDNQEKSMLAAVQAVQDAYRLKETSKLEDMLFKDSRDAVAFLRALKEQDRPAYFAGFEAEARETAAYAKAQATKTPQNRQQQAFPEKQSRPWKRFSQHFFSPVFAYLDLRDKFLAMTRLWAIDARCRSAALKGAAPASISDWGPAAIDPYSGKPFVYYAAGADYKVYSVGRDGRDDGGHSDDGYQPDMRPDAAS